MQAIQSFQDYAAQFELPKEPGRAPPLSTMNSIEIALHHRCTAADMPAAAYLKMRRDGDLLLF